MIRLLLPALLLLGCASPPPADAPAEDDGITLISAGEEPRASRRLQQQAPGREERRLSLVISGEQVQGGLTGLTLTPPVFLELELRHEGESLNFSGSPFTLGEEPLAQPEAVLAMEAALDGTQGFTGSGALSPAGELTAWQLAHADAANTQAQQLLAAYGQTLSLAALRFPSEPVGVGASWSWVSEHRQTLGVLVKQANTAALLGDADGRLRVVVESVLSAERQRLSGPPLPAGGSLDVTTVDGRGRAELVFVPGALLPVEAEVQGHWELTVILDQAGRADEVRLLQDMTLVLETP